jgi:hypothetical protein
MSKLRPDGALTLGLFLTLLQIAAACLALPATSASQAYSRLCRWDCEWYLSIAQNGYHSDVPPTPQKKEVANVAFFPAYPVLGATLARVLPVSPRTGLILTAQLFCVLFWAALWRLLMRWRVAKIPAALCVLAIFVHPASFYLISAYSESLFLAALLLFILRASPAAGFLLSSTRIVGIPAAGFPLLHQGVRALLTRRLPARKKLLPALAVTGMAAMGGLSFFIYCKLRFGRFDLYMESQRIGWGIRPDYLSLVHFREFQFKFPIDRFATLGSLAAFAIMGGIELITATRLPPARCAAGLARRLPLYLVGLAFFYISLSGLESLQFLSMIRYSLPWTLLLGICLADLASRGVARASRLRDACYAGLALALALVFYFYQLPGLRAYLGGRWFA